MSQQVDLDALGDVVVALRNGGLAFNASMLESAITELREARELLACATGFHIGESSVTRLPGGRWIACGGVLLASRVVSTLPEALAAAREWEKANA